MAYSAVRFGACKMRRLNQALFSTLRYDRYIPTQILIITLLHNDMLTVPRERKPVETSGVYFGSLKTFLLSIKLENIRIGTSLNILVTQNSKT